MRLFILPVLREPHSCPPPSIFLGRFSSSPPFLFSFSSSFLSFCHSRDILSELARYNFSLSSFLSLSFSLYSAFLSPLSHLFSVSSRLTENSWSINPSLFQRDDSKYTLTPLPFPVTLSFVSWTRAAIFHPFDFHKRHSLLICPFSRFLSVSRRVSIRPPSSPPRRHPRRR